MRILQLHSNYLVYKPVKKEISMAEEAAKEENRVEEVMVLFIAIEEGDKTATVKKAIDDAHEFLKNLKVNRILLYPFAHLRSH
jgi:threonyl-tRNA synthetase